MMRGLAVEVGGQYCGWNNLVVFNRTNNPIYGLSLVILSRTVMTDYPHASNQKGK